MRIVEVGTYAPRHDQTKIKRKHYKKKQWHSGMKMDKIYIYPRDIVNNIDQSI